MTATEIKREIRRCRDQITYVKDPEFTESRRKKIILLRAQLAELRTYTGFKYKWLPRETPTS